MANPSVDVRGESPAAGFRQRITRVGLRGRLLAAILLVALTTVAVGIVGVHRMSSLSDRASDVYTEGTVPLAQLKTLETTWWQYRTFQALASIPGRPAAATEQNAEDITSTMDSLRTQMAALQSAPLAPDARAAFDSYTAAAQQFMTVLEQINAAAAAGDSETWARLSPVIAAAGADANEAISTATTAGARSAEATSEAAHDAYRTARTVTIAIILLGLVISIALALLVARSITAPVQRIREVLDKVAGGDLRERAGHTGGAELQHVASSLDRTLDTLGGLLAVVGTSSTRLSAASTQLTGVAGGLAQFSSDAADQSERVERSARDVASSVDTVATGSAQMETAIREIAHNAAEAARVADQAVREAEATTRTVGKLGTSSQEIAEVVKLINGIAEQTNLLALNATIEAARAGESGKGFAVVASEVKELAQETARATEDISTRVQAIQADTTGAVDAIGRISAVIAEINDFQATIAAAVEEQTATTNEMNRNVAEAADSSRDIASAITGLASGTQETSMRVADAQAAASELHRMSDELHTALAQFTV
ncbi:methyl-accepting chemotaxis protein [Modestobacter roseus]|uniref:Methyl-accepting chemotaxis protein n=1 Tax=Modestobacter roseus TaxID=1181884 RepID=A0A562INY0_9ACTN|nr:methyl-accepting chemotaxis protein [Modestobacter roseus]MQA34402.1 HAMP domain-containing protein [Modestobacter roseus]TWH72729.1 methyl-accepting chemotaxis protein [Modestobacter roseus]